MSQGEEKSTAARSYASTCSPHQLYNLCVCPERFARAIAMRPDFPVLHEITVERWGRKTYLTPFSVLCPWRKDRDRVHHDEVRGIGYSRALEEGRGRQRALVRQERSAHFAIGIGVLLDVGQIGGEPHHLIHAAADGCERGLDVG